MALTKVRIAMGWSHSVFRGFLICATETDRWKTSVAYGTADKNGIVVCNLEPWHPYSERFSTEYSIKCGSYHNKTLVENLARKYGGLGDENE